MSTIEITVPESVEADVTESRAAMETLIRDRLGISRDQFLKNLDHGEYADAEDTDLLHLVTLAPFAR